jgi:hypothetical protein
VGVKRDWARFDYREGIETPPLAALSLVGKYYNFVAVKFTVKPEFWRYGNFRKIFLKIFSD